ncbi:unnamed protein product [Urochloa humidicola]
MEGKRVAAAALYCMFIMLSGQQQVAGFTRFCGCFGNCYPGCRENHPRWICTIKCVEGCAIVPHEEPVDCSKICLASICGAAETGDGPTDAGASAACVDDCAANWKRYREGKHT